MLGAAVIASASIGAFTFTPLEMWRYVAQSSHLAPLVDADALGRNVFVELRLPAC